MIDVEKRIVVLGDNDVKVAATSFGMIFGDASVPDNKEDIESSYLIGLQLSMPGIIEFDKDLSKLLDTPDGEKMELDTGATIFEFKTKEDLLEFRNRVREWACGLILDAQGLLEYVQSVSCRKEVEEQS